MIGTTLTYKDKKGFTLISRACETKNQKRKYSLGFTLIELLVVITIIGILATFAIANYSATRERARDTQRKNDLNQIKNSLIQNASGNDGLFPKIQVYINESNPSNPCIIGHLELEPCIFDPIDTGIYRYLYRADGYPDSTPSWSPTATKFSLSVGLESFDTPTYWIVCSDGRVGESNTATDEPPGEICPLP